MHNIRFRRMVNSRCPAFMVAVGFSLVLGMVGVARDPGQAGEKPAAAATELKVQKLIEQLDDDKFSIREQATKELQLLGRSVVPQLEAALKRGPSPETRRRLVQVLDWYRVRPEWHTDRATFVKRLKGPVREVHFDDLDTKKQDPVSFPADHYAKKLGVIITGRGGQYAGRTFGFPGDYRPVSAPNMYAPGPPAKRDAGNGAGGFRTDVTFAAGKRPAVVAGFAVVFIDADYPGIGPSSLQAFDRKGKSLGEARLVQGANASQVFCGVVAVDGSGSLLPAIARVHLVNGANWPGVDAGEGVTLDDFLFAEPVAADKE